MNENEDAEGYVEITALQKQFNTPAWLQIMAEDSNLMKVLKHPVLKNDKCEADHHVAPQYLIILALLYCPGKPQEKAEELYGIFQEGGLANHTFIAASDKDLPGLFKKFCDFVTIDLFTLMEETVNVESGYSEDELEKLREAHEDVREEAFLEDVFGHQSRISNQDFLNAVVKKATYMFSAQQLRKKVFEHAKVTMKSNLIA